MVNWFNNEWEYKKEIKANASKSYQTVIQQSISATTITTITPWFTPVNIEFSAYENWNPWSDCHTLFTISWNSSKWAYTSWAYNWTYIVPQISDFSSTTSCLRLDEYNTANNIRARVENVTATSFDLNFYEVEYTWYVTIIIKCFW